MHHLINKKILLYVFFLLLFGTINNHNLIKVNFLKISNIKIYGLKKKEINFRKEN